MTKVQLCTVNGDALSYYISKNLGKYGRKNGGFKFAFLGISARRYEP